MSLSKLAEKCMKCPFVNECENKKIEALATIAVQKDIEHYISDNGRMIQMIGEPSVGTAGMPVLRETIDIPYIDGKRITIYKDELEERLKRTQFPPEIFLKSTT
jgi:hypothetical protein